MKKIQEKLSARKIWKVWSRKRVEIRVKKMPEKLREMLRRFFLRIKINIVLCNLQGKSFLSTLSPKKKSKEKAL